MRGTEMTWMSQVFHEGGAVGRCGAPRAWQMWFTEALSYHTAP